MHTMTDTQCTQKHSVTMQTSVVYLKVKKETFKGSQKAWFSCGVILAKLVNFASDMKTIFRVTV